MGRHFTEDKVMGMIRAHAADIGYPQLSKLNGAAGTPDAVAVNGDKFVEYEIKACKDRYPNGQKGRFYIDPKQHKKYGTKSLWYVLVVYNEKKEIVSVKFVRSDQLPQREQPFQMTY